MRQIETVVVLRELEGGGFALEEKPLLWQEVWPWQDANLLTKVPS